MKKKKLCIKIIQNLLPCKTITKLNNPIEPKCPSLPIPSSLFPYSLQSNWTHISSTFNLPYALYLIEKFGKKKNRISEI